MADGHAYEQRFLAERVREIMRTVAEGSATKLARLMNGLPTEAGSERSDPRARNVESDRRQIQRWLAADALMDEASRVKLLAVANRVLSERGEEPFSPDFLTVVPPDPIDEISWKLDLLLVHLALGRPVPALEVEGALARLERRVGDAGRSGLGGSPSGGDGP